MYIGPLTLDQVANSRLKALQNAEELLEDSRTLYRNRNWARTLFLSQIAVEEAGKYFYLISSCVAIVEGSMDWRRFWKAVRSHSDKTTLFLVMEDALLCKGCTRPQTIKEFREGSRVFERAKVWALYSDYEQNEFYAPGEVIRKSMAKKALDLAGKRVGLAIDFESSRDWSRTLRRMTNRDLENFYARVRKYIVEKTVE